MLKILKQFIKEEKGQTLVEWIAILSFILIIIIGVVKSIGNQGKKNSDKILKEMQN